MASQVDSPSANADANKSTTFPVILGATITDEDAFGNGPYTAVQYNHKPDQTGSSRKALVSNSGPGSALLTLTDKDDEGPSTYKYKGAVHSKSSGSYVLVPDASGNSFSLEKVGTRIAWNLVSSPWLDDSSKLKELYPQVTIEKKADEAEEGNPYDFRRWLHERPGGTSPDIGASDRIPSASTSVHSRSSSTSESLLDINEPALPPLPPARPLQRKESSGSNRPGPGRPRGPKPKPKAKPAPPKPEPQRDDYADDESSEDDGGLTIELDPDSPARPGLAKRGFKAGSSLVASRPGLAPISLRSAASSISPHQRPREQQAGSSSDEDSDEDVMEDVTLPPPAMMQSKPAQQPEAAEDEEEEESSDEDAAVQDAAADDYLEVDLEAEIAQALGSEDVPMGAVQEDSEPESEEE